MFDAAPDHTPTALQQSEGFARALQSAGVAHQRLGCGTLIVQRRFGPLSVSMMTRPQTADGMSLTAQIKAARIRGPLIIAPETVAPLQQIGALPLVSPAMLAALDLHPDMDKLMAGLHGKWRNRLRHAQTQNLRVTRQNMPDQLTHWLLDADAVQQGQRGYRGWPRALTLAFARENRGDAKLFTAMWGREPVAAILVLRHGRTATYHIGHTRPSGRIASAHNLLMWNAITWAKSKGLTRFELGTINTEDAPGLARFKLGTGAIPQRLGGTWLRWTPLTHALRPMTVLDRKLMHDPA